MRPALFDATAALDDVAEDVGRHNAVDKIVGRMLMREALPLSDRLLCVSGRTSFEIVRRRSSRESRSWRRSRAVSLAVELWRSSGVTLVGFIRGTASTSARTRSASSRRRRPPFPSSDRPSPHGVAEIRRGDRRVDATRGLDVPSTVRYAQLMKREYRRLTQPLVRDGGALRPASWDEALARGL